MGEMIVNEPKLAIFMMIFAIYSYFHTVVCVIIQMCRILDINALTIKKK
jgi:hypothetical protein